MYVRSAIFNTGNVGTINYSDDSNRRLFNLFSVPDISNTTRGLLVKAIADKTLSTFCNLQLIMMMFLFLSE